MTIEFLLKYGSRLIILFMCIPVHEFAHAWAATKMGDDTPAYQGRLTLNPLAHLDPIGSIGILLCGFGWGKPVQVNPLRFKKYRKGMAITAAAGPLSNIIMALIATVVYKFVNGAYFNTLIHGNPNEALSWLSFIAYYFIVINIGLAVFNLIPVQPLDGEKIFSYFASDKFNAWIAQYQQIISLVVIGLLIFSDWLDGPLSWFQSGVLWLMDKLTFWVDPIVNAVFRLV